ncbi:sugar transferase [Actinomadura livida]|uniref:Exopolysaccharide biosynthesis polyprenyl glycosylphosphotransferase n=1 Tax=Actinomadura livida TaxID=79909 RepID=A0A7W7IAK7_9ACTN|nr:MULTISPECIES: sugar transferase [Actinomadura]MBB4773178.1 exopolysaccharide biosynthesis polyprenyl glycosylphosphotransferase [Actinomadura catellatispora]GGU18564.1 exopolysaccharide biosynthesis polyprenyl glycosylphosphotransferase [Actinomadura livida]
MAVVDKVQAESSIRHEPKRSSSQSWSGSYRRKAGYLDFLSMLAAGVIAFVLRFPGVPTELNAPYVALTVVLPMVWLPTLMLCRAYQPRYVGVGYEEFHRVLRAGFILTATVAIVAYATKTEVARGYVVMALPLGTFLNLMARYRLRKWLHKKRWNGECMRRVVAVGHRTSVADLIKVLRQKRYHGMDIAAVCLPPALASGDDAVAEVEGVPVMGDFSQAAAVADRIGADSVAVLACPEMDGVALRRLAWQIERDDVELVVAPALMDVTGPRISIRPVSGLPLLHVEHPELDGGRKVFKGLFDRTAALAGLVLLSPLLLVVAVLIKTTSSGPVLFRQARVGRGGREFTVLKFRTMVQDAEQRKVELLERNENDGVLFKIREDPRITRVGRWLRRYSLDELPQLINVLRGEMSLVGPRPPLPEEVAQYGGDVYRRLVVKPGLTGLWQVSGRSDLSWEESVRLDLRYVDNWTLALDLQIMWKTWSAVFRGSGAY